MGSSWPLGTVAPEQPCELWQWQHRAAAMPLPASTQPFDARYALQTLELAATLVAERQGVGSGMA